MGRGRDGGTEGQRDMLTEKVVLVTSPLLCAMPPLRLPGLPPPWCFLWLPTMVSMEWLRTRMALCGTGTAGHHHPAAAVPTAPPQTCLCLPENKHTPRAAHPNNNSTPQQQHTPTAAQPNNSTPQQQHKQQHTPTIAHPNNSTHKQQHTPTTAHPNNSSTSQQQHTPTAAHPNNSTHKQQHTPTAAQL